MPASHRLHEPHSQPTGFFPAHRFFSWLLLVRQSLLQRNKVSVNYRAERSGFAPNPKKWERDSLDNRCAALPPRCRNRAVEHSDP